MIALLRRIAIAVVFVMVIITGWLWVVSGKTPKPIEEEKYSVSIYEKNDEKFDEVVNILTQEGHELKVNKKVKKTLKKPVAFKLYQKFREDENPGWHAKNLKKKKIGIVVKKSEDDELTIIEIKKVYKTQKQADEMVKKLQKITAIKFEVKEKIKEFPYTTNEIIIREIASMEAAEAIKEKVSSRVKYPERDITIEAYTSGEIQENKEVPESDTLDTPDKTKPESDEKDKDKDKEKETEKDKEKTK